MCTVHIYLYSKYRIYNITRGSINKIKIKKKSFIYMCTHVCVYRRWLAKIRRVYNNCIDANGKVQGWHSNVLMLVYNSMIVLFVFDSHRFHWFFFFFLINSIHSMCVFIDKIKQVQRDKVRIYILSSLVFLQNIFLFCTHLF